MQGLLLSIRISCNADAFGFLEYLICLLTLKDFGTQQWVSGMKVVQRHVLEWLGNINN